MHYAPRFEALPVSRFEDLVFLLLITDHEQFH